MARWQKPNTPGLIKYLASVGLDAHRIPVSTADETGFDYWVVDREGRPVRTDGNRLKTERREWPSQLVYTNVMLLMQGGALPTPQVGGKDLPEPKTEFTAEEVKAHGEKQITEQLAREKAEMNKELRATTTKRTRKPKEEPAE